jgi:hypothetical protein
MRGKHWLLTLAALAVFAAFAGAARAGSITVTDPAHDQVGLAPDITAMTVSDSGGVVTVTITATGLIPNLGADTSVTALLDTDQNVSTGFIVGGAEYAFTAGYDGIDPYYTVGHWVGPGVDDWEDGWTPTTGSTWSGDDYSFTFTPADIGGAQSFDFVGDSRISPLPWHGYDYIAGGAFTVTQPAAGPPLPIFGLTTDGSLYLIDMDEFHQISPELWKTSDMGTNAIAWFGELPGTLGAPATADQVARTAADYWKALEAMGVTREAAVPPAATNQAPAAPGVTVKPVILAPLTTPAKPTAGKTFTVNFPVVRSDTGAVVTTATMICDPSVQHRVIRHVEHFENGKATLRFTIPKTAKGKLLKVHLTMVLGSESMTRVATFRVG